MVAKTNDQTPSQQKQDCSKQKVERTRACHTCGYMANGEAKQTYNDRPSSIVTGLARYWESCPLSTPAAHDTCFPPRAPSGGGPCGWADGGGGCAAGPATGGPGPSRPSHSQFEPSFDHHPGLKPPPSSQPFLQWTT